MPKLYRMTQHWDHWLTQFLGQHVVAAERRCLQQLLSSYYGKYALLLGVPQQQGLLKSTVMPCQYLMTPLLVNKNKFTEVIESEFYELPFASGSVDLVLVPHTLEHLDNPRKLLSEACRIVKPEGHIIILGFNPMSLWGLKKTMTTANVTPWNSHFIQSTTVKKWLGLADFELVLQDTFLFRPPTRHQRLFRKLTFLEWLGNKCYKPFGGVYVLIAKAKVVPLTPIRMRWQQKLSSLHATFPGPSMRDSLK